MKNFKVVTKPIYLSPTEPAIENGSILIHGGHILSVGVRAAIKVPPGMTCWRTRSVACTVDSTKELRLRFKWMSRAGMSFQEILASLTTNPAQRFGYSTLSGRIAKGMDADLVILGADPAQNTLAFSRIRYTIRNGEIIYTEK